MSGGTSDDPAEVLESTPLLQQTDTELETEERQPGANHLTIWSSITAFISRLQSYIPGRSHGCHICKTVLEVYNSPLPDIHTSLGFFRNGVATGCPVHTPLFRYLEELLIDIKQQERHRTNGSGQEIQDAIVLLSKVDGVWYVHLSWDPNTGSLCIRSPYLEFLQDPDHAFGHGQKLDRQWIEPHVLDCYRNCKTQHGSMCSSSERLALLSVPRMQYLVDIIDECIVRAQADMPYVALSYVWGQVECLKTTLANVADLQKPGSLRDVKHGRVPKTIQDTMGLMKILGERYLWADTLSIVQDDFEDKEDQLQQMARIYAYAEVVIIAADGPDSEFSLREIRELSEPQPRDLKQLLIPFGDKVLMGRIDPYFASNIRIPFSQERYFQRGWTFQEFAFARRRLIFKENSVCFECMSAVELEDVDYSLEIDHASKQLSTQKLTKDGLPIMSEYMTLVNLINNRQFTFPEDILPAFCGTMNTLLRPFPQGFICGHPEMFFDVSLLWQPHSDVDRRLRRGSETEGFRSGLPSWSWAGWCGILHIWSWNSANDFIAISEHTGDTPRAITSPITTWYTAERPDAVRRKIDTQWRDAYQDPSVPLPKGWSRKKYAPSQILTWLYSLAWKGVRRGWLRRSVLGLFNRHDFSISIPWAPIGLEFVYWHEVTDLRSLYPLPPSNPDASGKAISTNAYLFSRVRTACLYVSLEMEGAISFDLLTRSATWVGVMSAHSASEMPADGEEIEIIAISEGYFLNDMD
ncbi:HET-domain-containing protein [Acephala macrosclerotiorum]|nr:HET-domain-containing protein [Acephala macrosclerotiorum]